MRLLLVEPRSEYTDVTTFVPYGGIFERILITPRLTLPQVAALTPEDVDVRIVDENFEEIDFSSRPDLVGITILTSVARRAYRIADQFRSQRVPVVLGGGHPSVLPDEGLLHADSVVVGEAEPVWGTLIEDFRCGRLKRRYDAGFSHDLRNLPLPRRDLLNEENYLRVDQVQFSRGCPFDCEFCSVPALSGPRYRFRPVEDVVREMEGLTFRYAQFVDDNVNGNLKYAFELAEAIAPLRKKWFGSGSINVAWNARLLRALKASGCSGILLGLESVADESITSAGKRQNSPGRYREAIRRIHDAGILTTGSFVFGLDGDDPSVFDRTLEFLETSDIKAASFAVLTPYPGTQMYERLKKEGRLIRETWWLEPHAFNDVLYRPKKMTPEQLHEGYSRVSREFYSMRSAISRLGGVANASWPQELAMMAYSMGQGERNAAIRKHTSREAGPQVV